MNVLEYASFIIIGVLWSGHLVVYGFLRFMNPTEIYFWNKVFDKCSPKTAKYRYVIRFVFRTFKPSFQLSKTTITIEVWNAKQVMSAVQIKPKQLIGHIKNWPNNQQNTVRFILYRSEPLGNITTVMLNHDSPGTIDVVTVEIQDVKDDMANIAYIGQPVKYLIRDKALESQKYSSVARESRTIESGLRFSRTLSQGEFIIYIYLAINTLCVSTVYVIPCESKEKLCIDYRDGLISSVYSGIAASVLGGLVFYITIFIHRYCLTKSKKCCSVLRYPFLYLAVIFGTVFGIITVIMASGGRKFGPDQELHWSAGVAIALSIYYLIWISSFSYFGYKIGFFSDSAESKEPIDEKTLRTETDTTDGSGNDPNYMQALIKGNAKVKSISQYGGLSQNRKTEKTPPRAQQDQGALKDTKATKRTSVESLSGEGYFRQLMKGKEKIKSVSQYKGPAK